MLSDRGYMDNGGGGGFGPRPSMGGGGFGGVPIVGDIIGGIGDIIAADKAAGAQREAQESANRANAAQNASNNALQREFAQMGIQWKVADAKAAGLHPLYALGASTHSFAPSSTPVQAQADLSGANLIASLSDRLGQNVSRALHATSNQAQRQERMMDLQLQNQELQNAYLSSQIANLNQPGSGPALPSNSGLAGGLTGQGDASKSGYVNENALQRTHSQPGNPPQEVGAVSDYAYVRTEQGYAIVPSTDVKNKIEDQMVPEAMWALRNQLAPALSGLKKPDPKYYPPPAGYDDWKWSPLKQQFVPFKKPTGGRLVNPRRMRDFNT